MTTTEYQKRVGCLRSRWSDHKLSIKGVIASMMYLRVRARRLVFNSLLVIIISSSCLPSTNAPHIYSQIKTVQADENSVLRLILQSSKNKYATGELLDVTAFLENTSPTTSYYVGRSLGSFSIFSPLHYIELVITNQKGKEVQLARSSRGLLIKTAESEDTTSTLPKNLEQYYVQLEPSMIYGIKDQIDILLQPGTYKLTAKYQELNALMWTEAERNALSVPIWTQPLVSNTVTITVIPRASSRVRQ